MLVWLELLSHWHEKKYFGYHEPPGEGHGNPLQILAWRIPWTEEPGGLQSLGLHSLT